MKTHLRASVAGFSLLIVGAIGLAQNATNPPAPVPGAAEPAPLHSGHHRSSNQAGASLSKQTQNTEAPARSPNAAKEPLKVGGVPKLVRSNPVSEVFFYESSGSYVIPYANGHNRIFNALQTAQAQRKSIGIIVDPKTRNVLGLEGDEIKGAVAVDPANEEDKFYNADADKVDGKSADKNSDKNSDKKSDRVRNSRIGSKKDD